MLNIGTVISGLKAASELIRITRDGIKKDQIKPDELSVRLGEVYEHILNSQDALIDAKEEINTLKARVLELEKQPEMTYIRGTYWLRETETPFCQHCWEIDGKRVRLSRLMRDDGYQPTGDEHTFYACVVHQTVRVPLPANTFEFHKKLIEEGRL